MSPSVTTVPFAHQPSLLRAFDVFAGWDRQTAGQAAADLQHCLSGLYRSQRLHNSWNSSLLTGCRFPVELAFSSLSDTPIRFCTEIDSPEVEPASRLDKVFTLLEQLGSESFEQAFMAKCKAIQASGKIRFGAWLGGKYGKDSHNFKLYLDLSEPVADLAKDLVCQYLGSQPLMDESEAKLVMIGKETGSQGIEFYYEMVKPALSREQISALLARVNMSERFDDLVGLVDETRAFSSSQSKQQWPETTYGFSLALAADGTVQVLTLFTFADHFIGGDGEIRHAVLSLADKYGWQLPLYRQISEPFTAKPYRYEFHNIISFSLTKSGKTGLSISLAPPGDVGEPPTQLQPAANNIAVRPIVTDPDKSHTRLIDDILDSQTPSGAFTSFVTLSNGKTVMDENGFVTAKVLRCLKAAEPTLRLQQARQKALDFLQRCEVPDKPGAFSFWPNDGHPHWMGEDRLPPDIDDTSVISVELYQHGRIDKICLHHIAVNNINAYRLESVNKTRYPWKHSGCFNTWMDHNYQPNPVDCIVNINALILLELTGVTNGLPYFSSKNTIKDGLDWACDSLKRLLSLTPYYPNPTELYFALKNADDQGLTVLDASFSAFSQLWQETIISHYQADTPVYCREDGVIIWTAPVLFKARQLFYQF